MFGNDVPQGPLGLLFNHLFGKSKEIAKQGAAEPQLPLQPPTRERVKSFDELADLDYVETKSSRKRSNISLPAQGQGCVETEEASAGSKKKTKPQRAPKRARFAGPPHEDAPRTSDGGGGSSCGSGGSECEVTAAGFFSEAQPQNFVLSCAPRRLGSGFGWSKAGGRTRVALRSCGSHTVQCSGPTLNVVVTGSKDGAKGCGLSAEEFLSEAKPQVFSLECAPYEFSTGSLGWMGHSKQEAYVAGKRLRLQINLNCPIVGSKSAARGGPSLPTSSKARAAARRIDFGTIGRATRQDNLTAVKGIGPFIQERLHAIGIQSFEQIAAMTPAIEEDVNEAIEYFPGRVKRDEWALQAQELAAKKKGRKLKGGGGKKDT